MSHRVFLRNLIPRVSSRVLQRAVVDLGLGAGLYRVQIFRPNNSVVSGVANGYLSYETAEQVTSAIQELDGRIIPNVSVDPIGGEVAEP